MSSVPSWARNPGTFQIRGPMNGGAGMEINKTVTAQHAMAALTSFLMDNRDQDNRHWFRVKRTGHYESILLCADLRESAKRYGDNLISW